MNDIPAPVTARKSFDDDGLQWAWDATSIYAAMRCQRYYQYSILEGWESPGRNVHLWWGGLYATALEHFYKHLASGMEREDAIRAVVREALISSWDHERVPDGGCTCMGNRVDTCEDPNCSGAMQYVDAGLESGDRIPGTGGPVTFDINEKTRFTLIRSLVWYFEEFADDFFTTLHHKGKPAVEYSFQFEADNGIALCGHIDRVVEDKSSEIYVQDQKSTKSTLSSYYFDTFNPHVQFPLYTFAGQFLFNTTVRGVILDAVQTVVGFSKYARVPILFTPDELNEYYDEWMHVIELTRENTRNGYFPKSPPSCFNCQYRSVCSQTPSVRRNYLEGDFKKRATLWDPIARR